MYNIILVLLIISLTIREGAHTPRRMNEMWKKKCEKSKFCTIYLFRLLFLLMLLLLYSNTYAHVVHMYLCTYIRTANGLQPNEYGLNFFGVWHYEFGALRKILLRTNVERSRVANDDAWIRCCMTV